MFCISPEGQESIIDVATAEAIESAIRMLRPGRYNVDEVSADSSPNDESSRRWGVVIKRSDGTLDIRIDPREA
jgi:hypothetical protein